MNPQSFGKYQLLKKLATGGMAEVWLARQTGIEGFAKNLVVKRILPHLAEDREFVEMFKNEALIAARFNHPNIAQVYEFGEANGTYYIAMEFIHGEDLGRVMRKAWGAGQWIARPLAIRIVASACEGLYYAHTRTDDQGRPLKVVHRDISPQNILISFDGSVKLVDFGIAKAADQVGLTKSGAIKGKFAYMAPKQAAGKALDHRADIFAIGLVLYELLTGVRPLKRDSELATLQAALECAIQQPSEVADVPAELDSVVMSALAKAADDRYRDARQFQIALEETLVAQRWVASSVQISELMETLFADRLEEEKKTGGPVPGGDDSLHSGNRSPPPPSDRATDPGDGPAGRGRSAEDMEWEAPSGEVAERREPPRRSSTSMRPSRERDSGEKSLADEMSEFMAPQGGGTAVARRRTGESPRRGTNAAQQTIPGRTSSRSDNQRAEDNDTVPPPRRSSSRHAPIEADEPPPRPRGSRTAALAVDARARYDEDPYADPERTRLPPRDDEDEQETYSETEPEPEPETLPPPPRRRTGHVSRIQPAAEPAPAPRRRTSSRVEMKESPRPSRPRQVDDDAPPPVRQPAPKVKFSLGGGETLKKVFLVAVAVAVALVIFVFRQKIIDTLTNTAMSGEEIFVSVDTTPKVMVKVRHNNKNCSPEPFTELGMTPIKNARGVHIQDTLVLENKEQGIYAEENIPYGEPGELKNFKREFKMGQVRLKLMPKPSGKIEILRDGQELGVHQPGMKLDLVEGTHTLELRGESLKEPVPVEVQVKRGDLTEAQVDISKYIGP
jgi:serine/threonine protein kinase